MICYLQWRVVISDSWGLYREILIRKLNFLRKFKVVLASILIVIMILGGGYAIYFFSKPSENKKVIATIFPIYDITREIMGNDDDVMLLEDTGVDIHSYTPIASDIMSIHKSQLFIYIGGESDEWVGGVLKSSDNPNLKTLCLLEEINGIEESDDNIIQGEEHHHEEEDNHDEDAEDNHGEHEEVHYDEHIWLSLKNAKIMTEKIRDSLSLVFPERKELFKVNANKYLEKLEDLDKEYAGVCTNKTDTLIIADRFPFIYLTEDYDIKYYACFSGCSTETQASADTISKLIDKINMENADKILVLETSDKSVANSVINDSRCKSGVETLVINSCQSVSAKDLNSTSYLDIMQSNLEIIKKVLKK